ncbi:MAG TPA: hypothetical protein VG710_11710 [Opitutus sp.]|nr:hypothetical protein [Opitutus sp.]
MEVAMNGFLLTANFLLTSITAGVLGGAAMVASMWLMARAGLFAGEWEPPPRRSMVVAVGGLITKSRASAFRVGLLAHAVFAIVFAMIYAIVLRWLGAMALPASLIVGVALGFGHGLVVSLGLVWVAEGHPFEEYNDTGLAVGVAHMAAHVVYGAVVGLVIGLMVL